MGVVAYDNEVPRTNSLIWYDHIEFFSTNLFLRDQTAWPTNYYGYVQFADGDVATATPDYLTWILSIDDANDANQRSIV